MPLPSYYKSGNAKVTAGSRVVTGSGTAWKSLVKPNDLFGAHRGCPVRIESVETNTQLTLAYDPPARLVQEMSAYEITITPQASEVQASVREIVEQLRQGVGITPDATGTLAQRANYNAQAQGFVFLRTDVSPFLVYVKTADTSGSWSAGQSFIGTPGTNGGNGLPGVLKEQYSVDIRHPDGNALTSVFQGQYDCDLAIGNAGRMTRFFGQVREGSGSIIGGFAVNGTLVTEAYAIAANAPVNDTGLQIDIPSGADVSFHVLEIIGEVRWIWLKVDGSTL